ncbi:hypothetical protein [Cellulomonas sp. C5510]|uniref:hypothetical protein n=1 Tax=Cellulomonas sp. C5510 TaxID=2871170 RepID=UPI001C98A0DB|nr:hypothetical protein [Cellulomonas sp. C5510]QZN86846.1 hypothetical protein K5O09_06975 [Cellulomonas sp. C5510]
MRSTTRAAARLTALAVALATVAGLAAVGLPAPAQAAGETESAVTVAWAGGNDPEIQQHQPDHAALTSDGAGKDAGSGHWDDFRDLRVTVSQTRGLIDQAVTVTASGMAPTVVKPQQITNFLQVFQCWGDPAAADFARTCQWGAYDWAEVGGNASKLTGTFGSRDVLGRGGVTFRAVTGQVQEQVSVRDGAAEYVNNGLGRFFDPSSSNEQPFVPVRADGTATTSFTVQSAASQPYLGCGDGDSAAGSRCWLVVVPRGSHSNSLEDGTACGSSRYGEIVTKQVGTPLDPTQCTSWHDRVVVPLDFEDPYLRCPAGSAERRVVGSELVTEAISSWQPRLCGGDEGAAFGLTTNSGDLTRAQLLTGQVGMAAVSAPLTRETIGGTDPALLESADPGYAPLVNTALTIGFVAESPGSVLHRDLRLTPRLLAKLLTQSYAGDLPQLASSSVGESLGSRTVVSVLTDPEWAAVGNPTDFAGSLGWGAWVVVGPQGDDATRLLWQYVLADADARAFLEGEPDPWGMTVNPYYLPPGHAQAVGGGLDLLSQPLDTFPKADQTVSPDATEAKANYRGLQVDGTTYSPYSTSFAANASRIAHVDSKRVTVWDPQKFSGTNVGFWVSDGPQNPADTVAGRLILGPTSAASALTHGISSASLALPLPGRTAADTVGSAREFVAPDDASVAAAVAVQRDVEGTGVATPDPGALPAGAYPLATTVYAAVDLASTDLDQVARSEYAHLLDYAAGAGNVHTGQRGGLPEGYVPLTADQVAATRELAELLRTPASTAGGGTAPPVGGATVTVPTGSAAAPQASPPPEGAAAPQTGVSRSAAPVAERTPRVASPVGGVVGASLLAGAGGLLASPFLLRRRGTG